MHPELGLWPHSSQERRRDELILCRLRIGHAYLTHRHLLCGDPPPVCIGCQERLSVEHILIHCVEYIDIRHLYFNVNTVFNLTKLYIKSSHRYSCSYFIFVPNLVDYGFSPSHSISTFLVILHNGFTLHFIVSYLYNLYYK